MLIVRLTILGCCGSIPGPDQAASGYLLEADGFRLGLDLGNGTLARLQTVCDPFELNALVLSHLHPDHCADFSALTVLRRYHPNPPYDPRRHRLPVHAPAEAPTRLANAYAPHEAERQETDLSDVFDFRTLSPEPRRIGPFTVTPVPVLHPTESFGVRITYGDVSFAYTGDTGLCAALDELADGVDVLLCEASWTSGPDRPDGLHLSGAQAGELAARARVGRLLLTHIPPWSDGDAILAEAEAAFDGPTERVTQGAVYEF
ncbi:metal-dependent hydrolase, beta-lactamase superfamily III [Saccharomonospora viridis DSM 43017]|uniref:Metal-dependent hydrolase, beta-lactamase superfamily III n=1 Tax=Saccharomonospora viridis (strain ATCC 15386 / DSM 43017 / JCM 3036 / CCUG 5913 / NBRC 12207 / NCIMB 9602 / P101) TaxID=471857 RepID=C7MWC2_SACVD|nr:metal-dependent hydrolase, beta-lactamase superfamily III [Saccharomonospora viridis DSM 43017]